MCVRLRIIISSLLVIPVANPDFCLCVSRVAVPPCRSVCVATSADERGGPRLGLSGRALPPALRDCGQRPQQERRCRGECSSAWPGWDWRDRWDKHQPQEAADRFLWRTGEYILHSCLLVCCLYPLKKHCYFTLKLRHVLPRAGTRKKKKIFD